MNPLSSRNAPDGEPRFGRFLLGAVVAGKTTARGRTDAVRVKPDKSIRELSEAAHGSGCHRPRAHFNSCRGRAVWSARLVPTHEVGGSNPPRATRIHGEASRSAVAVMPVKGRKTHTGLASRGRVYRDGRDLGDLERVLECRRCREPFERHTHRHGLNARSHMSDPEDRRANVGTRPGGTRLRNRIFLAGPYARHAKRLGS